MILATGLAAVIALGVSACGPAPSGTAGGPASSQTAQPSPAPSQGVDPAGPAGPAAATPTPTPRPALIPPPGAEDVDDSTADGPVEAAPLPTTAAGITETVAFDTGMVIEIVAVDAIEVTAQTPGEVDGPAVRVTVRAHNGSTEPQSVDSAVVAVTAGEDVGIGTTAGDPDPLAGELVPGATVSGVYVFMLDPADDREITVSVNYAAGEPVAVFTGMTS